MQGRRIPARDHEFPNLERPGDYAGPIRVYTGSKPAVFFLKPNARDPNAPRAARSVQHVVSPPHTFIEEPDGSLTIKPSISDKKSHSASYMAGESDGWHGYLTHGIWSKA